MANKNSGMAVTSLVLGLSSVLLGWIPFFGQILSILAIVFGFVALSNIKYDKTLEGKNMAIWGIVLGFLWLFLLIIFVSVGIGWVFTNNVASGGSPQVELTSKCFQTSVIPTMVSHRGNTYNVTLSRDSGSSDEIEGVMLIFSSENEDNNQIIDIPGNIESSSFVTESVTVDEVSNPDRVEVAVYFISESGEEQLCHVTNTFEL
jgi:hypothetical protein